LICAINADVEAMKVSNAYRLSNDFAIAYGESHFWDKAEELRILAAAHNEQL
jgi:hypothetical protein